MQPGDIVLVRDSMNEHGMADKFRPCLVLNLSHKLCFEKKVYVAYGTSKRTNCEPQPWELLLNPQDGDSAWSYTGLRVATVFSFQHRHLLPEVGAKLIGALHPVHFPALAKVLAQAAKRGWH